MKFMLRELFPRMDIQLSPEIAIRLYYIIIIILNKLSIAFLTFLEGVSAALELLFAYLIHRLIAERFMNSCCCMGLMPSLIAHE